VTTTEILSALEEEVTPDGLILLDKLKQALGVSYWPDAVFAAAKEVFGDGVYARTGRTYKALDERIRHALREWDFRYGPLSHGQQEYAAELLVWAIKKGAADAAGDRKKLYPFVQAGIGRIINHERVCDGFTQRAETVEFNLERELAAA
jgi:hypothetical protein